MQNELYNLYFYSVKKHLMSRSFYERVDDITISELQMECEFRVEGIINGDLRPP